MFEVQEDPVEAGGWEVIICNSFAILTWSVIRVVMSGKNWGRGAAQADNGNVRD